MSEVRVRFAPSPTGYLHIGGARTALFNWLYARHTGGTFVLRIEDTDTARNTQEAVDVIIKGLQWLGLDWDEGPASAKGNYGPYFQSLRGDIYKRRVDQLLQSDKAYQHEGAIKFRMQREGIEINDLIVGKVFRELTDREAADPDFVIVRSDGQPVFHLVNVIDDLEMRITHVIRGEDHLSNTAKHIALFRAFGEEPPAYAHIPLILNPDGSKMSKRDAGASLTTYMDEGYAPEAVVNYLSLLGWSPKNDREVIPLNELIQLFDLPQVLRHNARFDFTKLQWLNGEYFRLMTKERFAELAIPFLEKSGLPLQNYPAAYTVEALATCKEKVKILADLPPFCRFYFTEDLKYDPELIRKDVPLANVPLIQKMRDTYATLEPFTGAKLEETLKSQAKEAGVKAGVLVHPVRVACTGSTIGPSLYHLLELLGKERVLKRLDQALLLLQDLKNPA